MEALRFRNGVCGGESQVRDYCTRIAREGGEIMAAMMGTNVLENRTGTLRDCCFTNVRLPLQVEQRAAPTEKSPETENYRDGVPAEEADAVANWVTWKSIEEFDTFIATRYYASAFWVRISGQIYLERRDFEWAATVLLELCSRVKAGRWREDDGTQALDMR